MPESYHPGHPLGSRFYDIAHARIDAGRVKILTRRGNDWTDKYPTIANALAKLPAQSAYLDGELCGVLPDGRTAFNLIQNAMEHGDAALVYFVFDLLYLDGEDLTGLPLVDRKTRLEPFPRRCIRPDPVQRSSGRPRPSLPKARLRARSRRHRLEAGRRAVRARPAVMVEDEMPEPGGIRRCRLVGPGRQPPPDRRAAARLLHAG
jgi:hypothetical protein